MSSRLWLLSTTQSDLVKVYVGPSGQAREVLRLKHIGWKAHGLVSWGKELILLDSDRAVLVSLDPDTNDAYELWGVSTKLTLFVRMPCLPGACNISVVSWTVTPSRSTSTIRSLIHPPGHSFLSFMDS
jgi:hypothetical protein